MLDAGRSSGHKALQHKDEIMKDEKTFLQRDLGVAAFMIGRDCHYLGLHPIGGRTYAFEFADGDGRCSEVSQAYWRGESCSGEKLVAAIRFLKNELQKAKTINNQGRKDEYSSSNAHPTCPAN